MTIRGTDSYGPVPPAALHNAGYAFAARYLSHQAGKRLTRSEVDGYHAHSVAVVVVFEDSATNARGGAARGHTDGLFAGTVAANVGIPKSRPIYAAVDFQASNADMATLEAYFRAFHLASGHPQGIYGDAAVCIAAMHWGFVSFYWQTDAWSNGVVARGIHIWQDAAHPQHVGGVEVDVNTAYHADYGQTPAPAVPTPPHPPAWWHRLLAYPVPHAPGVTRRVEDAGHPVVMQTGPDVKEAQRKVGVTADGLYGPASEAAVRRYQTRHHLHVTGDVDAPTAAVMGN